ncbi:MAG: hypothetical protein ACKOI2_03435 [Actinomycetota bacterium]
MRTQTARRTADGSVFERNGKWVWRADAVAGSTIGRRRQVSRYIFVKAKVSRRAHSAEPGAILRVANAPIDPNLSEFSRRGRIRWHHSDREIGHRWSEYHWQGRRRPVSQSSFT